MRNRIESVNINGKTMAITESKVLFGTSRGVKCASSATTANRMTAKRRADLKIKAAIVKERMDKEARRREHSKAWEERKQEEKFKYTYA